MNQPAPEKTCCDFCGQLESHVNHNVGHELVDVHPFRAAGASVPVPQTQLGKGKQDEARESTRGVGIPVDNNSVHTAMASMKEFESLINFVGYDFERDYNGDYTDRDTYHAWLGYVAAVETVPVVQPAKLKPNCCPYHADGGDFRIACIGRTIFETEHNCDNSAPPSKYPQVANSPVVQQRAEPTVKDLREARVALELYARERYSRHLSDPGQVIACVKQHADRLEAAYLAHAVSKESAPRWIPVSERLPEDKQIVLCYNCQPFPITTRYRIDEHYGGFRHGSYPLGNVTHWMPIDLPSAAVTPSEDAQLQPGHQYCPCNDPRCPEPHPPDRRIRASEDAPQPTIQKKVSNAMRKVSATGKCIHGTLLRENCEQCEPSYETVASEDAPRGEQDGTS